MELEETVYVYRISVEGPITAKKKKENTYEEQAHEQWILRNCIMLVEIRLNCFGLKSNNCHRGQKEDP